LRTWFSPCCNAIWNGPTLVPGIASALSRNS
jgi:hypothetical protein